MPTNGSARARRTLARASLTQASLSVQAQLLSLLDEAFDHVSWHGPTLLGSLRGVSADAAAWRPSPRRHNIWEVAVHAAYWKYAVRRRLAGGKRGTFPLKGSNWFPRPSGGADAAAWQQDQRLLIEQHTQLREAVAGLTGRDLARPIGTRSNVAFIVRGIAAHDLYHAGQVQLLKRLQR